MKSHTRILFLLTALIFASLACQSFLRASGSPTPEAPTATQAPPTTTPTPLPTAPVQAGEAHPDEPVFIRGEIPYTSPFFVDTLAEPFVLLEDEAGFVARDRNFTFPLAGQLIGPVEILDDGTLRYTLSLPAVPQGTLVDVDNNGQEDQGVQVFAIAYWSNTWGGPFLEERDGYAWSTGYASTITDPDRHGEIEGGTLLVWVPNEQQGFPTGFGDDDLLFTEDDPTAPIPVGYNLVDLNQEPFRFYKEAEPVIDLIEGASAVNDFSSMGYGEAFEAMFEKVSREYPFTKEKGLDWQALHDEFSPRFASVRSQSTFYRALKEFTLAIPDAHVGMSFDAQTFFDDYGGSFGLRLAELSDGRVLVIDVLPGTSGADAGIQPGAEIIAWDGTPVQEALDQVVPFLGPYSTSQQERLDQLIFLTRYPSGTRLSIQFQNPGDSSPQEKTLTAEVEYDSLFDSIPSLNLDELALPVEGQVLDESGLGYIRLITFSDDYNLMARLWERFIQDLIDNEIPGLIIDIRSNGGGSGGLASDFAGFFFDKEIEISHRSYYNDRIGEFEFVDFVSKIKPAPLLYEGKIAVLVSPNCISACEGFAYMMQQEGRSVIIGHAPTAGAFGEVGQGQYDLPDDISMQFPTGRPETLDGKLLIEGVGVLPDIVVPVTEDSALGKVDAVLEAAIKELLDAIGN